MGPSIQAAVFLEEAIFFRDMGSTILEANVFHPNMGTRILFEENFFSPKLGQTILEGDLFR